MRALAELAKDAMELLPHDRLVLAGMLLEGSEPSDEAAEITWEFELADRVLAVDQGTTEGISYEDVMSKASRLIDS